MKVMQLLSSLMHEESERGIYHIGHAIIGAGHDSIIVASAGQDNELVARLIRDGNKYHQINIPKKSWSSLRQIFALRRLVKHHKPDIIHVHSRTPAWILHWVLRTIPKAEHPKIVSTLYGFFPLNNYSRAMFDADVIITASQSIDKDLQHKLYDKIIDEHENSADEHDFEIVCVQRGVDVRQYPYRHHTSVHWLHGVFAQYPELEHKKWLLFPTPIGAEYGQEWLIDIIGNLREKFPNIHAIIMDDDPTNYSGQDIFYEDFTQRIQALGLKDYFTFIGKRPVDKREWLSSTNLVLALANRPESIGITTLQAIHLGTPVIGWAKGAHADILSTLFSQGLIKEQSATALCKIVKYLLQNRIRPAMTHEYEIECMVAETLEIYQNLLQKDGKACKLVTKDRHDNLISIRTDEDL